MPSGLGEKALINALINGKISCGKTRFIEHRGEFRGRNRDDWTAFGYTLFGESIIPLYSTRNGVLYCP